MTSAHLIHLAAAPATVWDSGLAVGIAALVVAGLLGTALFLLLSPNSEAARERIVRFIRSGGEDPRLAWTTLAQTSPKWLTRAGWSPKVAAEYEIAAIEFSPAKIVTIGMGAALIVGVLVAGSTGVPFLAVPPLLAAPFFMWLFIRSKADGQRRQFGSQLADHLGVVAGALRSGLSLPGALASVIDDSPEPTRREFTRAAMDVELGASLDASLERIAERMNSRDMEQVATLAALQRESGTNAAEALEQVIATIREREELRRTVRTLTAQGRLTRWILGLLPVAVLFVLLMINPMFMEPLFGTTLGRLLIGLGIAMNIAGSLIIKRIIKIEV
jgi:tight adherence protein B